MCCHNARSPAIVMPWCRPRGRDWAISSVDAQEVVQADVPRDLSMVVSFVVSSLSHPILDIHPKNILRLKFFGPL